MRRAQSLGSAAAAEDPDSNVRRPAVTILDEVGVTESADVGVAALLLLLLLEADGTRVVPKMFSSALAGCFHDDTLCSVS